jgi:hypothetical protein
MPRLQDELDGARVCTVCRDLVLVCPKCQSSLREYHCYRHAAWKECYFSFLEVYGRFDLQEQLSKLMNLRETLEPTMFSKNTRRALARQIVKVRFVGKELVSSGLLYYALPLFALFFR